MCRRAIIFAAQKSQLANNNETEWKFERDVHAERTSPMMFYWKSLDYLPLHIAYQTLFFFFFNSYILLIRTLQKSERPDEPFDEVKRFDWLDSELWNSILWLIWHHENERGLLISNEIAFFMSSGTQSDFPPDNWVWLAVVRTTRPSSSRQFFICRRLSCSLQSGSVGAGKAGALVRPTDRQHS